VNTYAQVSPYAQVNTYAQVSPYAQVNTYAQVSPYAQVNTYAQVSPYVQVNTYAQVNATCNATDPFGIGTPMLTGWTVNPDGSLHIAAMSAGATSLTVVMIRNVPTAAAPISAPVGGGYNYGDEGSDDHGDSDEGGDDNHSNATTPTIPACVSGISTTPLLMFLSLLSLTFVVARKKA